SPLCQARYDSALQVRLEPDEVHDLHRRADGETELREKARIGHGETLVRRNVHEDRIEDPHGVQQYVVLIHFGAEDPGEARPLQDIDVLGHSEVMASKYKVRRGQDRRLPRETDRDIVRCAQTGAVGLGRIGYDLTVDSLDHQRIRIDAG